MARERTYNRGPSAPDAGLAAIQARVKAQREANATRAQATDTEDKRLQAIKARVTIQQARAKVRHQELAKAAAKQDREGTPAADRPAKPKKAVKSSKKGTTTAAAAATTSGD